MPDSFLYIITKLDEAVENNAAEIIKIYIIKHVIIFFIYTSVYVYYIIFINFCQ
jgi:hypothetical protein